MPSSTSSVGGDPAGFVEFTTLEPFKLPALEEALAKEGIEVRTADTRAPGPWIDMVDVRVRRRDVEAATEALRRFRRR